VSEVQSLLDKWWARAPIGLSLIGFGLSVTGDAIMLRAAKKGFWRWFLRGTLGLCILNAGISVFGDAVKRRALEEWRDSGARLGLADPFTGNSNAPRSI
jgi:hypothetical protein